MNVVSMVGVLREMTPTIETRGPMYSVRAQTYENTEAVKPKTIRGPWRSTREGAFSAFLVIALRHEGCTFFNLTLRSNAHGDADPDSGGWLREALAKTSLKTG